MLKRFRLLKFDCAWLKEGCRFLKFTFSVGRRLKNDVRLRSQETLNLISRWYTLLATMLHCFQAGRGSSYTNAFAKCRTFSQSGRMHFIALGLNDEEAAAACGISKYTLSLWQRDEEFLQHVKNAVAIRLAKRLERIEAGW